MGFIADEVQQTDARARRHSQPDILDAEAIGDLWHEAVDGECDDEEEVEGDEGEGVGVGHSSVSGEAAEAQPEGAVLGYHGCWANVLQGLDSERLIITYYIFLLLYIITRIYVIADNIQDGKERYWL